MENTELEQLDRRRSMRLDLENEPVQLTWKDSDGEDQSLEATCIDISRRGLLVKHSNDLQIGTKLIIQFSAEHSDTSEMKAKVARCHRKNFSSYHMFLLLL
ncbi:PilZ domain-containing protein [Agarivorans aestuarii]|uniref:PilZ domain-containing protein n=1 Tax=Agarivorans aestuarii TaxID=1563703 RepID=A0ABU7G865_9ALTE|nr:MULTISPECIES: PilZ domain-containing protein [Agarivorans]MEE1675229.1 PilZ domain-containing protein [Agarivorans aestuarii]